MVPGRTLEFGFDLKSDVLVIPKGATLAGSTPDGGKGMTYTTKYGMLGANAVGLPVIVDGINDQGLYVGIFYFPGYASYPEASKENAPHAMAPHEYANWILGNFANIDEVKANFDKVVLVPVVVEAIKQAPPVHFVIHDRSGKSVVIEPVDKTLKIHDNPLGVMSNAPTFDWHMTNLRNYINLTATNVPPVDLSTSQAGSVWPRQRHAWAARRFHAALAIGPGGRLFASGAAFENRAGGRASGLPYPE